MLVRRRLFQRILLSTEMARYQTECARCIGVTIINGGLFFATGITVQSVDNGRCCVYYPWLGEVHVQGDLSFGYMLSKQQYRERRAKQQQPPTQGGQQFALFASAAHQATPYAGVAVA